MTPPGQGYSHLNDPLMTIGPTGVVHPVSSGDAVPPPSAPPGVTALGLAQMPPAGSGIMRSPQGGGALPGDCCWLYPPPGSGLRISQASPGICLQAQSGSLTLPAGWSARSGPCAQPPPGVTAPPPVYSLPFPSPAAQAPAVPLPPQPVSQPTGGSTTATAPAAPSLPNVTINGQKVICCPCNQ